MKKKSALSIILAICICLSTLVMSASALVTGDLDGNGKPTATDARTVLRASVGLEDLNETQKKLADANFDGFIRAEDARLILRASVGLETLREQPAEHPAHHVFTTISMTGETKCSFSGCTATLPSFNSIVNVLKTSDNGVNKFTELVESIDFTDKADISGTLAFLMKDEENVATTKTTYEVINTNRFLTDNNFPAKKQEFVSNLTDKDVTKATVETVSSIDFLAKLPDNFTSAGKECSISAIKAAKYPDMYKITIVIPDEKVDITKPLTGTSTFDKIYFRDYNKSIEETRKMLAEEIAAEAKQFEEMGMKYSGSITSSLTVEYFVDADTLAPVAARYSHAFKNAFSVEIPVFLKMTQKMNLTENFCYFFNPEFTLAA